MLQCFNNVLVVIKLLTIAFIDAVLFDLMLHYLLSYYYLIFTA